MNNELILTIKNLENVDIASHSGSYELIEQAVKRLANVSPTVINNLDLEMLYQFGNLKHGKKSRDNNIKESNLPNEDKEFMYALNAKIAAGKYTNTEGTDNCGLFAKGRLTLRNVLNNEGAQRFIALLIDIQNMDDSDAYNIFEKVKVSLSKKIAGLMAGIASQILNLLKPNVFPILNSVGRETYEKLGLKLHKPNNIETYADNARIIYDFRANNLTGINFRTIDSIAFLEKKNDELVKFKALLEWFVRQMDINIVAMGKSSDNTVYGYGYSSEIVRDKYRELREYKGFTLDCSFMAGMGTWDAQKGHASVRASRSNYINYTSTYVNIYPILSDNKKSVGGLELAIKSKNIFGRSIKTIIELGLFEDEPPNSELKKFFEELKKMIEENKKEKNMQNTYISNLITDVTDLLKISKNIILTGAPGTGKTYLAKNVAAKLLGLSSVDELSDSQQFGFVQFHPSYDYTDFVEGLRPKQDENGNGLGFELKNGIFKQFCKTALIGFGVAQSRTDNFEEAYDKLLKKFTLPIDSLTIPLISGRGHFEIQQQVYGDGLVTKRTNEEKYNYPKEQLYKVYTTGEAIPRSLLGYMKAIIEYMKLPSNGCGLKPYVESTESDTTLKPFVFIIDEINRGEISKIFGELFFSIDPGYRGKKGKVTTQYNGLYKDGDIFKDGFYVPENVYTIGTMNDIDRSVESFDFAMRRRFLWREVTSNDSAESMNLTEEIKQRMTRLNNAISEFHELGSSYHIGGAYYLGDYDIDYVWKYRLEPLLKEYLRGVSGDINTNLKKLENAYKADIAIENENN